MGFGRAVSAHQSVYDSLRVTRLSRTNLVKAFLMNQSLYVVLLRVHSECAGVECTYQWNIGYKRVAAVCKVGMYPVPRTDLNGIPMFCSPRDDFGSVSGKVFDDIVEYRVCFLYSVGVPNPCAMMHSPSAASTDSRSDAQMFNGCENITDVTIQEALKLLGLNAIVAPQCSFERSLRKVSSSQYKQWQKYQMMLKDIGVRSLQAFPEDFITEKGRRYYRIQVAVDIDADDEGYTDNDTLETVGECLKTRSLIEGRRVVNSHPAPPPVVATSSAAASVKKTPKSPAPKTQKKKKNSKPKGLSF